MLAINTLGMHKNDACNGACNTFSWHEHSLVSLIIISDSKLT